MKIGGRLALSMNAILIIIGCILLFTLFGLTGWVLKGLGAIFDVLLEGSQNCLGCGLKIIVALILLYMLIAGLLAL